MKRLIFGFGLALLLAPATFASEESLLVRVTGYWRTERSGQRAAWNGARLRAGDCAVDPRKIPYGSRVVFPDMECVAVDTGPGVVNRKSARARSRTGAQEMALVIDRFFETKQEAVAWMRTHSKFITVRVITPEAVAKQKSAEQNQAPLQLASQAGKH
jgi:3D (Asp-Asp-Asp) domain-containing protein